MKIAILIIIGAAGGVLGGMGMGGGTLLIPLLTLAAGIDQHLAQAVNLMAFIPMSAAALALHVKNKLVRFSALPIAVPAAAGSVAGSFLSRGVSGNVLGRCFGAFLAVLGAVQLVSCIVGTVREAKREKSGVTRGADGEIKSEQIVRR